MGQIPLRFLIACLFLLLLSCGGDDGNATATRVASATTQPEATSTPSPTASASVPPEPTKAPWDQVSLVPFDRSQPVTEVGTYLLDVETMEVWYIGRGGSWSPYGSALASGTCCVGDGKGITILEIPSGSTVNVSAGDIISLAWSGDSKQIAFVAADAQNEQALFVVNRDGTGLKRLAAAGNLSTGRAEQLRWLDDDMILYAKRQGIGDEVTYAYFRVGVTSGASSQLTPSDPPGADDPRVLFGEASPGGRFVAYEDNGLYVWSADSGEATLIDPEGRGASWSRDGTKLLFASTRDGEGFPFWRLYEVASQTTTDLPDVGFWAQWTADGRLAHDGWRCPTSPESGIHGTPDVMLTDAVSGSTELLTHTPDVPEYEGLVSPSGEQLAFVAGNPDRSVEYVDLTTGARSTVVTANSTGEPFHVHPGNWSPDGRYLEFGFGFAHGVCD